MFPDASPTIGPAIDDGFYYDFFRPDAPFTADDLGKIEERMRELMAQKFPFAAKNGLATRRWIFIGSSRLKPN